MFSNLSSLKLKSTFVDKKSKTIKVYTHPDFNEDKFSQYSIEYVGTNNIFYWEKTNKFISLNHIDKRQPKTAFCFNETINLNTFIATISTINGDCPNLIYNDKFKAYAENNYTKVILNSNIWCNHQFVKKLPKTTRMSPFCYSEYSVDSHFNKVISTKEIVIFNSKRNSYKLAIEYTSQYNFGSDNVKLITFIIIGKIIKPIVINDFWVRL